MSFKSEASEPTIHWTSTYIHMKCPYCQVHNVVDLGNLDMVLMEKCLLSREARRKELRRPAIFNVAF